MGGRRGEVGGRACMLSVHYGAHIARAGMHVPAQAPYRKHSTSSL